MSYCLELTLSSLQAGAMRVFQQVFPRGVWSNVNALVIGLQAAPESPHLCVSATLVPTPNTGDTQKAFVLIRMTSWLMF